ncbi:MAG: hypothetical protein IPL46_30730 [Saprospiraceae bacterium]|nr:hypothetical protein [Saprospiraceae bacterium]
MTGCYRSGTTLVDKYLSNHPDCLAFSQPITPLFIHTKEAFYREIGISSKNF